MGDYWRDALIKLCEDAVVSASERNNRDSYSSQVWIASIYDGLTAWCDYEIKEQNWTLWITFNNITDEQLKKMRVGRSLYIDDRDDYFEIEWNEGDEMFDWNGIDFINDKYKWTYMPTRERLDSLNDGEDWY